MCDHEGAMQTGTTAAAHSHSFPCCKPRLQENELAWRHNARAEESMSQGFLRAALQSRGAKWIAVGWTAFIGENLILSHNRDVIIGAFGEDNYRYTYSFLSTAACGSIAYGLLRFGRGKDRIFASRSPLARGFGAALQVIGLVGASQQAPAFQIPFVPKFGASDLPSGWEEARAPDGKVYYYHSQSQETRWEKPVVATPASSGPAPTLLSNFSFEIRCPIDFKHGANQNVDDIQGMDRVSRHATFWSLGLFSLGRALPNVFLPEIIFYTFPAIYSVIGSSHQDYRYRRGSGGTLTPEREAASSNLPFVALVTGRQSWAKLADEFKWMNAGAAALVGLGFALRQLKRMK